jgi:hypothetical protein
MNRCPFSVFLVIIVVLVAAPALAAAAPVPVDLFTHHLSIASVSIAAPSYTINEWLALRKYSRAEWYRMKTRGETPAVIGAGRMQRITPEADAKWLRAQERKAGDTKRSAAAQQKGRSAGAAQCQGV